MFPQRAGPAIEPVSQLQQLVKPIEQSLLRLEQRAQRPVLEGPVIEEKEEARKPFSIQDMRHMMAQYVETLPMYEEPKAAQPSVSRMMETSDMGTQTRVATRETGTQVQLLAPDQPLIRAGPEPLVDRVVSPMAQQQEFDFPEIREPASPKVASSASTSTTSAGPEEEQKDYTTEDIRALEKKGKITKDFLEQFQVRRANRPEHRGFNLLKVASSLGVPVSRREPLPSKKTIVDLILESLRKK